MSGRNFATAKSALAKILEKNQRAQKKRAQEKSVKEEKRRAQEKRTTQTKKRKK